jgi:hypothetical protein
LTTLCWVKHSDDDRGGFDERRLLGDVHLRELDTRVHAVAAVGGSDNSSNEHGTSDGESCGAGWVVCAGGRGVGGVCVSTCMRRKVCNGQR